MKRLLAIAATLLATASALGEDATVNAVQLQSFFGAGVGQQVQGLVYRGGLQLNSATDTFGGLSAIGGNLLKETAASGSPTNGTPGSVGIGTLVQGYTEASNVDAVAEITALIVAQRAYEMNSKVISTADNMLATANQVKA